MTTPVCVPIHPGIARRMYQTPLILFAAALLCYSADTIVLHADIRYAEIPGVDPNLLSLDVYTPAVAGAPSPVLIFVHGGSWQAGDKAHAAQRQHAAHFTGQGFVFVSVNYRLSPECPPCDTVGGVKHPKHVQDLARAVTWVHDSIAGYNGDPDRIGIYGHSAGGHLAALLAVNGAFLGHHGLSPGVFGCACLLDPAALDIPFRMEATGGTYSITLKNAFGTDSVQWIDASPTRHCSPSTPIPPFLCLRQDRTIGLLDNGLFTDSLLANGHDITTRIFAGLEHEDFIRFLGAQDDTSGLTDTVTAFFRTHLTVSTPLFELASTHEKGPGQATVILDMDDDGDLDFVSANKAVIHYVRNDGSCRFSHAATEMVDNANGFGMHDFNGDGRMDFAIAQGNETGNLDIRINTGRSFTRANLGSESVGPVRNIVFADFDGDGYIDSYHSASAFGANHAGNQFHRGLSTGLFGRDIIREILNPPVDAFWYDTVDHPDRGPEEWSNKQSKAAIARDLDGDGKPEIVFCSYADRGFQEDAFATLWIEQQNRGVYVLRNNSTPGNASFTEVAKAALGADAYGATTSDWNTYSIVPLDYDLDGDFDLFVGATIRATEMTDLARFYENVSTPGTIAFVERTEQAGFAPYNDRPADTRSNRNWAAGAPVDFDNDGWVDLAVVNRKDGTRTPYPYVHLFRNNGDKTFVEVPYAEHGIGGEAGGRDINYGDLDGDGKQDLIVSDGTVGGYEGTNTTLVYKNKSPDANNWVALDVRAAGGATWAIGTRVTLYRPGTDVVAGSDEVRTDFCYRSKRHPVLHFGLGDLTKVDVEMRSRDGESRTIPGLEANRTHTIQLVSAISAGRGMRGPDGRADTGPLLVLRGNRLCAIGRSADALLRITDMRGKCLMACGGRNVQFDISRLAEGTYIAHIANRWLRFTIVR